MANLYRHFTAAFLLIVGLAGPVGSAWANDPADLIGFSSDEGMTRLIRSPAKADFAALANQFEAQPNSLFCGPTSAAIVLNALFGLQSGAPALPRFTPDTVIGRGAKTRAQVFGEPVNHRGKMIQDFGYQLRQLDEMLQANGVRTRLHIVDDAQPAAAIRAALIDNLKSAGDYVIVNYLRRNVGQSGGGHISPLAAYDADSDSFLVLDVNQAAASWVWMPADTLIKGMRSFDTVENRGFVVVLAP